MVNEGSDDDDQDFAINKNKLNPVLCHHPHPPSSSPAPSLQITSPIPSRPPPPSNTSTSPPSTLPLTPSAQKSSLDSGLCSHTHSSHSPGHKSPIMTCQPRIQRVS